MPRGPVRTQIVFAFRPVRQRGCTAVSRSGKLFGTTVNSAQSGDTRDVRSLSHAVTCQDPPVTTWTVCVAATLNREVVNGDAHRISRTVGTPVMVATHDETRLVVTVEIDTEDPSIAISLVKERFVTAVENSGYRIQSWEALQVVSPEEEHRRRHAAVPPLVSTAELARMCGVEPGRIRTLESQRKKAERRGEPHELPKPVVPGWWTLEDARKYEAERTKAPGPRKKPKTK